jgi:hypothetical protein
MAGITTATKILPIGSIVFDKGIYPRQGFWWAQSYAYSQEMLAGAKFPMITVGYLDGKHVLIDGKHRLEAYKINKEKHISCNVIYGMTRDQMFIEAIRLNISNGVSLSTYDKVMCIKKLEDMSIDIAEISKIIQVPLDKISQFVARRMTITTVGGPQVLKSALRHLAGTGVPVNDDEQDMLSVSTEWSLVNQMIQIFSNNTFPRTDDRFIHKVRELYELMGAFLESNKIKKGGKAMEAEVKEQPAKRGRGRPRKVKA